VQQEEQAIGPRRRFANLEIRASRETVDAIRRLARDNERSIAGEVRLALNRHIAANRAAEGARDAP